MSIAAPGVFVTATGTGVGKTVLSGAITAALHARGLGVRALKPVITGLAEAPVPGWPHDHELLARAHGRTPAEVSLVTYEPAVSPHLAAELDNRPIDPGALVREIEAAAAGAEAVVVEGVGGLLVPLAAGYDVADLAGELGLPLLVVAAPGLGTINHTLLTLEAARARELIVLAVVFNPWPEAPDELVRSNRSTIERLAGVETATLPRLDSCEPAVLAAAGARLPLESWLPPRR